MTNKMCKSLRKLYIKHIDNTRPPSSTPGVIVFAGTVGAGKSTQMRFLVSMLKSRGLKVRITFIKTGHIFAHLLETLLAKMLVSRRKDVCSIRALIEYKSFIFRKLFRLWLILDMLSISIRFFFSVYLPSKMGQIILIEEYIPATIADYIYLAKTMNLPVKNIIFAINYMLRLLHMRNPTLTIFLDARDSFLVERWRRRKSLNEKADYLKMQRTLLLNLSKNLSRNFIHIDTTNKTIKEAHRLIVNHLKLQI